MDTYKEYVGLGVASNFALHLQQAGEAADFKEVVTDDPNGPKGMFPFYLSGFEGQLGVYPLSADTIILPEGEANVQMEPEVALLCDLEYEGERIASVTPRYFAAYNDCSIRKEGARKISEKKNWGACSKGLSEQLIPIEKFEAGGDIDRWRIASFLRRRGDVFRYGEDVELVGYSYFHAKLLTWIKDQINTQRDFGPLEDIQSYLLTCNKPKQAIISIGATRYTFYGESTFLREGDEAIVVLYNDDFCCPNEILKRVVKNNYEAHSGISLLRQKVIRGQGE
ncbi:MAG: hypothetical protein JXK05_01130 [Campylobacterales bacterium]|nr:hypothetical protein [Campylobacterales bacterium]